MKSLRLLLTLITLLFASCAGTHVSGNGVRFNHQIEVIGASAAGGDMSEAIVEEMQSYTAIGIEVKPGSETIAILQRLGIPAVNADSPDNLKKLQAAGLDAFMRITSTKNRSGGNAPGMITIRLHSTHEPGRVIEFVWENAWGGAPGSPADAMMRVGANEAATEVADLFLGEL